MERWQDTVTGIAIGVTLTALMTWMVSRANHSPGEDTYKNASEDVKQAIGKLVIGNTGCTGTVIGPVKDTDEDILVLTAAHCIRQGESGVMTLPSGQVVSIKCVNRSPGPDFAWCRGKRPDGRIFYAVLSKEKPRPDARVWHAGYGIDKPGNMEEGTFVGESQDGTQYQYHLSVSSGDSGGAIVEKSTGKVLSPVCCTTTRGSLGKVWGASPIKAAAERPVLVNSPQEDERDNPTLDLPHEGW